MSEPSNDRGGDDRGRPPRHLPRRGARGHRRASRPGTRCTSCPRGRAGPGRSPCCCWSARAWCSQPPCASANTPRAARWCVARAAWSSPPRRLGHRADASRCASVSASRPARCWCTSTTPRRRPSSRGWSRSTTSAWSSCCARSADDSSARAPGRARRRSCSWRARARPARSMVAPGPGVVSDVRVRPGRRWRPATRSSRSSRTARADRGRRPVPRPLPAAAGRRRHPPYSSRSRASRTAATTSSCARSPTRSSVRPRPCATSGATARARSRSSGPVVVVDTDLPSDTFVADDTEYRVYDGVQGRARGPGCARRPRWKTWFRP